jgi:hypothetical protein
MKTASVVLLMAAFVFVGTTKIRAQTVWSASRQPALTIADTAVTGDFLFEKPIGATRLSDGTIVVADATGAVLHFDTLGAIKRRIGRRGEGPGEFQDIWWLGQCGVDSVFVWDRGLRRMTVFDRSGAIVRTYPYPRSRESGEPFLLGCSRSGTMIHQSVARNLEPVSSGSIVARGSAPLFVGAAGGSEIRLLSEIRSDEFVRLGGGMAPRPLGKRTTVAVASSRLYVGTADSAIVSSYTLDGEPLPPIQLGTPTKRPTSHDIDRANGELLDLIPQRVRDQLRAMLQDEPPPSTLPPYSGILCDDADVLWVVLSLPGEPETRLRALDQSARVLGDIHLPHKLTVLEIGRGYILGATTNANGLPRVLLFHLFRGPR